MRVKGDRENLRSQVRIPIPSPAFRSVRVEKVFVLAKAREASDSLDISRPLALWE